MDIRGRLLGQDPVPNDPSGNLHKVMKSQGAIYKFCMSAGVGENPTPGLEASRHRRGHYAMAAKAAGSGQCPSPWEGPHPDLHHLFLPAGDTGPAQSLVSSQHEAVLSLVISCSLVV